MENRWNLPSWCKEPRKDQISAVNDIRDCFANGAKVVMLDAPTGSGKTLIAEMVRQDMYCDSTYVCTTKQLQRQVVRDFAIAKTVMGRANYPTELAKDMTCEDCLDPFGEDCPFCVGSSTCPYKVAKNDALNARVAVVNYSYWLRSRQFNRMLVVLDEADCIPDELCRSVGVSFRCSSRPKRVTKSEDWGPWVKEQVIPELDGKLRALTAKTIEQDRKRRSYIERLRRLTNCVEMLDNWIYQFSDGVHELKPIVPDGKGIWGKGGKFLVMSGTMVNAYQLAEEIGAENFKVVSIPMGFPPRRFPISFSTSTVLELVKQHSGRVLVHSVSYERMREICGSIEGREVYSYSNSDAKGPAICQWLASANGVMVGPSLERGLDLPGDLCRTVIVAKIPFPNLGDKQVSARLHSPGGQRWYTLKAIETLVQMCMRAMRGPGDWCRVYICDPEFKKWYNKNRNLFPAWFSKQLNWSGVDMLSLE